MVQLNKREKEVQQAFLDSEKATLKKLESSYKDALDEINNKIQILMARQDADMQHVIYQVQYQQALKTQVQSILETLQANEFETVSEYLTKSYEDGFIGTMYNLQGQGIPLVFPLDQEQVVAAIQTESKLSETLYTALGKDVKDLQKKIAGEISRGIATGMMYSEISRNVSNYARIPKNNAMRIVRTEAHRIQCKATMDACDKAKSKGADVVKQWDASMDKRTRDSHASLDGEIRELEKKFSNGLMYPGDPSGSASEVINCRCALLQRAKWALDRAETRHLGKMDDMTDEELAPLAKKLHMDVDELRTYQDQIVPINAKSYSDFKNKYNELWNVQGSGTQASPANPLANTGKSSKIVFKEAKDIGEAKKYAKDVLGLEYYDMDKVNIDCANMMNREIASLYDVFGNINASGHLLGIRLYPKKSEWVAAYSPQFREVFVKNVTAKNSISKMAKEAKEQFAFGFWSDDSPEHAIRHEVGHAIQHWLTDNDAVKLSKISALRQQVSKDCGITTWSVKDTKEHMKAAGNVISYYALRNDGEFIAEAVAEYMAGNPRDMAKQVVEILLKGR